MKKVYLAGFDVFYPDALERGRQMKELCRQYGLEGLYPLDNECSDSLEIFQGNLHLIDQCDFVAANLNPFRGQEMDSGTAFEIGYAFAKGKRVFGYLDDIRPQIERIGPVDAKGFAVENFGMPVNLMIGCSAQVVEGTLENCLQAISQAEA